MPPLPAPAEVVSTATLTIRGGARGAGTATTTTISLSFCEATTAQQRARCFSLGNNTNRSGSSTSSGGAEPDSNSLAAELQEHLCQLPPDRNNETRIWYLSWTDFNNDAADKNDAGLVLAACKTVSRDLLICQDGRASVEKGYRLAAVVTHPQYRCAALVEALLDKVTEWFDGAGGATATLLYAPSIDLYKSRGWQHIRGFQAVLWTASLEWLSAASSASSSSSSSSKLRPPLPSSRPITDPSEIDDLAAQDVQFTTAVANRLASVLPGRQVAVSPTAPTIRAFHEQAAFMVDILDGYDGARIPPTATATTEKKMKIERLGSVSNALGVWIYWYHDLRKRQLTIQRVHMPHRADEDGNDEAHVKALAQLLLDALEEALSWGLLKVVVWDPDARVERAVAWLAHELQIKVEFEERLDNKSVACVRWKGGKGDQKGPLTFHMNEYYAWSG